MTKDKLLLYLIIFLFLPARGIAAPKGAVSLPSGNINQSGSLVCGFIAGAWTPGRIIKGGLFYPRQEERNNIISKAKKASGLTKTKLLLKAKSIKNKIKTETPLCQQVPAHTPTPSVSATATFTATMTPTVTPTATPVITLSAVNSKLYFTEHSIFLIPEDDQVIWTGNSSYDSVYSAGNITSYVNTLKTAFPDDYFMVVVTAGNLQPSRVPSVLTYRRHTTGIGQDSIVDTTASNICKYHYDGSAINGLYGVLDHEVGHNWGVFIGNELGEGHWKSNSNEGGLMHENYSEDGFSTVKRISGDPGSGFTWTGLDNLERNETDIFTDRDLYLQGLSATFPPLHVLSDPVYNTNGTMSYSAVTSYDQSYVIANNGPRNPDYKSSPKIFRFGFVYVARDLAEIQSVFRPVEESIRHFVYADAIDKVGFRFQIPYLVASKYRASIDARLADLDGNAAPSISINGGNYFTTSTGTATVSFTAIDSNGTPSVSCSPLSANCAVNGSNVSLSNLGTGTHFFTLKAADSGGKVSYAHFVVDAN